MEPTPPSSILLLLGKLDGKMDAIVAANTLHAERINRLEERHFVLATEVQTIQTTNAVQSNSKKGLISLIVSIGALASGIAGLLKSLGFV